MFILKTELRYIALSYRSENDRLFETCGRQEKGGNMLGYPFRIFRSVVHGHLKTMILSLIFCVVVVPAGLARDVGLQWNANPETDLEGYRIYYSTTSGAPYEGVGAEEGDSPIDVKAADVEEGDTARFTLTGLSDDLDYYFVLTAYNTSGKESGYSVEVTTAEGGNTSSADADGGGGCFIRTVFSDK